ncbi:unnamed protein product [Miscanthus lutarioriparius]|uniref:Uncharacterized protein n=1 Tax=Miscanthus lutarioriparius TaxID=422564 RepID=A0A811MQR4_9POAL|nr:unnamed protein product [Miscanthus lutarioriparius]
MDWQTLAPKVASHAVAEVGMIFRYGGCQPLPYTCLRPCSHVVASAHPVEGEGGVGSVRQFNFTSAMPFGFMKESLEFLDVDKY